MALGADFNFCTNRNARFELNIGLDSLRKVGLNVLMDSAFAIYGHYAATYIHIKLLVI
jgi:hypothetical protein